MTEIDLLIELLEDILRDLIPEIIPLTPPELQWQTSLEANPIGVTLWHIARGMDFLATRVFMQKEAHDELWHTNGWRDSTGYDPRGIGYGGWGVLTGYSWEQVLSIPRLTSTEFIKYMEESCSLLTGQLRRFTPEDIHKPVRHLLNGKLTYFQWVKEFYKGFQAHIGEIMAIKEMMKRAVEEPGNLFPTSMSTSANQDPSPV